MNQSTPDVRFPELKEGFQPIRMNIYNNSYVSGDEESESLRVKYYLRESDSHVVAYAWFGPRAEGPPNHAHGGSIAALLDEAMGAAPWWSGLSVLAASIEIHFKELIPLGTIATVECWIERIEGRKVWTKGVITDGGERVFSTGEGLYLMVPIGRFDNIPEEEQRKFRNPS